MTESTSISRKALGQGAVTLGYFYDARSDKFLDLSMFNSFLPDSLILTTDTVQTNYKFSLTNTMEEKLSTLDIESSLKLSVLGGLVNLTGAGKYLNDLKNSKKIVRGALICEVKTEEEKFNLTNNELRNYIISESIISNVDATHVVIGIKWGANVVASFEYKSDEVSEFTEIEGKFGKTLNALKCSLQGKANFQLNEHEKTALSKTKIEFFGDILMTESNSPQTYKEALELIKKVPYLIRNTNNGKGFHLEYTLLSIQELKNLYAFQFIICRSIEKLDEGTIYKAVRFFDDLNSLSQDLNDLKDEFSKHNDTIPASLLNSIIKKISELNKKKACLRSEFSSILIGVRSGNKKPNVMDDFFINKRLTEFLKIIDEFISEKSDLVRKYLKSKETYNAKNIKILEKSQSIADLRIKEDDHYLLYCSFQTFCSSEDPKLKKFISLAQRNKSSIFKIIFYDIHDISRINQDSKLEHYNWRDGNIYDIKWIKNSDGDRYEGEYMDDKRHGIGTFICKNGDKYVGEWKDDKTNGKGSFYWINGDKYEGEWKDDKFNGEGTFISKSGDKYVGYWNNDKKNGKGTFISKNGDKYEGEWKDDKRHGKGSFYWINGDKYEGEWKDDKFNGIGTFLWLNGKRYQGEWRDNKRHGKGSFYWMNGDKYEGEWRDNKRHGKGSFYWINGDKYEGEWKDDKRHGKGLYYWKDGYRYEGYWNDDKKDGKSISYWDNCYKYGLNGRIRNGKGAYYWSNGDRHESEKKDTKITGKDSWNKSLITSILLIFFTLLFLLNQIKIFN